MDRTERFRRQHEELSTDAKEIVASLSSTDLPAAAGEIRGKLARFLGKLRMHAAMEDGALYPDLLGHDEESVRTEARELLDSVANLYTRFDELERRWLEPDAIERNAESFAADTLAAFALLRRRMTDEHARLYPLVDRAR